MQSKILHLENALEAERVENEKLREFNTKLTTTSLNAQSDLKHFQNVFMAQATVEAMNMCQEFFKVAHENMHNKASEAVKKIIEEHQAKERNERSLKPDDEPSGSDPFEKEIEIAEERALEELEKDFTKDRIPSIAMPSAPTFVQAEHYWGSSLKKSFYLREIGFIPNNYKSCPLYNRITKLPAISPVDEIPQFLRKPLTDTDPLNPSTFKTTVASMAHALGI
jgi:Golgi nucleoside diphosphatase